MPEQSATNQEKVCYLSGYNIEASNAQSQLLFILANHHLNDLHQVANYMMGHARAHTHRARNCKCPPARSVTTCTFKVQQS